MFKTKQTILFLTSIFSIYMLTPAQAYDSLDSESPHEGIDSYSAMELDPHCSPRALLLESEQAWRSGNLPVALSKVKHSLDVDNDDMDAHVMYANIMQEQLSQQTERDPNLYNRCVEEWLNVMRNKWGEEKNMRVHGINPFGDLYHDDERSILAKNALIKMTGYAPKTFETDNHYLKRVLLPSTTTVAGAVVGKSKNSAAE